MSAIFCTLETAAKCSLFASQSVSNSAEFELISKPVESYRHLFKSGFKEYKIRKKGQRIRLSRVTHRYRTKLQQIEKDYRWSKFVPSQFGRTARQCRVYGEGLHKRTTETWSSRGRQSGASQYQRNDLGIIHDCAREGSCTSRRNLHPIVNWTALTENGSCSSGRFSQGTLR